MAFQEGRLSKKKTPGAWELVRTSSNPWESLVSLYPALVWRLYKLLTTIPDNYPPPQIVPGGLVRSGLVGGPKGGHWEGYCGRWRRGGCGWLQPPPQVAPRLHLWWRCGGCGRLPSDMNTTSRFSWNMGIATPPRLYTGGRDWPHRILNKPKC